jgi:hypothetical protein
MGWTTCVKEWINKEDEYHPGGDIYYKNINDSNLVSDNIKQLKIKHGITKIKDIIGKDLFVPNEFTQNDFENYSYKALVFSISRQIQIIYATYYS